MRWSSHSLPALVTALAEDQNGEWRMTEQLWEEVSY